MRISAILEVCAAGPCTFGRLAIELGGVAPSTLSRHLRLLAASDLVRRGADGAYRLGPGAVALGMALLGRGPMRGDEQVAVAALAGETGESVALFELQGDRVVLVAKCEVPERHHFLDLFDHRLAVTGFFGAVAACLLPSAESEVLFAAGRRHADAERLARCRRQAAEAVRAGWTSELERGVWRLGAPLRRDGRPLAVVALARPGVPDPPSRRRLVACVLAAVQRLR